MGYKTFPALVLLALKVGAPIFDLWIHEHFIVEVILLVSESIVLTTAVPPTVVMVLTTIAPQVLVVCLQLVSMSSVLGSPLLSVELL